MAVCCGRGGDRLRDVPRAIVRAGSRVLSAWVYRGSMGNITTLDHVDSDLQRQIHLYPRDIPAPLFIGTGTFDLRCLGNRKLLASLLCPNLDPNSLSKQNHGTLSLKPTHPHTPYCTPTRQNHNSSLSVEPRQGRNIILLYCNLMESEKPQSRLIFYIGFWAVPVLDYIVCKHYPYSRRSTGGRYA
ncbi:hypothetical protein RRG08_048765 [Elysia crispata]|uniref:Uncharacterized protein n=1 Tax=Elysia crispata TaxID=231223 RepID=A0AAE1AMU3_9GAST|nr:hypothetical protein RRG08_048765 [Elysia crispata]